MANSIGYTPIFEKYFKRYAKKYRSLPSDLLELEQKLILNPHIGIDMGEGFFKIRLVVKSKNRGKSGGFRVITYLVENTGQETVITLIIIYDKSEISTITKEDLQNILNQ